MIDLTDQMRDAVNSALAEGVPVVVATASKDGHPDLAFKGSTMVFDSEHLAFWERSFGETLANIQQNPHVCLLYRSRERAVAWRFYGVAEIHTDGDLRRQVMERVVQAELDRDPERKGMAVMVRVDRVIQGRDVIMQRDA
jgi:predicted pyridoxine 5'-phosphate oxidase superfamily flavin-nucleotide-binding protein